MYRLISIIPGPTYNAHSMMFQSEYKELSKVYKGYILTTAPKYEEIKIGNFRYTSMRSENRFIDIVRFAFFCIWRAITFLLKGERFDLVVTYDPLKTGLIGFVIARIHRAKFAPRVNGVYTSPAEWIDGADNLEKRIKMRTYPFIMRFVLKHADGIRLLFKEQIDIFQDILEGKVIHSFPSFVATDGFNHIREENEILFVGFPFKRKGVDILIKAFKKIAPRYPDWKLKILGWYPELDELNEAIDKHPQIYHHPPVNYDEMREHMGSCSILVLPSRSEAMGRVLVEAMAAEKPRIGSDVDGIPTVIRDGIDGYLVRPGDVEDLAQKLEKLMSDPDLRRRLGRAGKERVPKEFSKEIYLKHVVNFYDKVLAKRTKATLL